MAPRNRRPSGFTQFGTLLKKDVVQELRSKDMLVSMGIYAVLVIIIFGVALSFAQAGDDLLQLSGGLLWSLIIFTSLMGLNRSFVREHQHGCLEGLLLAPLDRGIIFLSKATSNFIFILIVEIIAVPLYCVFFLPLASAQADIALMVIPLVLGSIGIAGVGTLLSTITAGTRGKDVLLAVLFVPIIFPLLYACVSATTIILTGNTDMQELLMPIALTAGYDVIMILLAWILYDYVVSA